MTILSTRRNIGWGWKLGKPRCPARVLALLLPKKEGFLFALPPPPRFLSSNQPQRSQRCQRYTDINVNINYLKLTINQIHDQASALPAIDPNCSISVNRNKTRQKLRFPHKAILFSSDAESFSTREESSLTLRRAMIKQGSQFLSYKVREKARLS